MVLSNNGLITKAKESKSETEIATIRDEMSMMVGDWQIEKNIDGVSLEDYFTPKVPDKIDSITNNGDGTYTIEKDGYEVILDDEGNIIDIYKSGPKPQISNIKVVANSDGTGDSLAENSTSIGTTLYITFEHSIEGGTTTVSPTLPYAVTENGKYYFTITGTVNGRTSRKNITITVNQFKLLIDELKIGDYVNYTYDTISSGYSLSTTYSGYNNNQTVVQSPTTLKWRILNIYKDTETIDLVSDTPSYSATVYLKGALGFNNGVYLLNDMCKTLYSNSSRGIFARSINLADMEKHLTPTGIAARNAYITGIHDSKYGTIHTITSSKYYPNIFAKQLGQGINNQTVNQPALTGADPYNESSEYYTTPTQQTSAQASTNLIATHTYYELVFNSTNYGNAADLLISKTNSYWIAARYTDTSNYDRVICGLRYAYTGLHGMQLYNSTDAPSDQDFRLRPIVSLSVDILAETKDSSGAWNLKAQ